MEYILKRRQSAFTLIEVLVVVVIMAILAAIVVPKIISRPEEAKVVRAKQDILAIQNAMDLYKLDNGIYPTTDQGIKALVTKPTAPPIPADWHGYLKRLPEDPWGQAYHYTNNNDDIKIFSYGPTGQPGGKGEDAEIGNWQLNS